MNVNAIKIDETKCAVIDEKGNIKVVSLNSNEQLEKLLLKENELENTKVQIDKYKDKILVNKNKSIFAEFRNAITYILDISIFLLGFSFVSLPALLSIICACHVLIKWSNIINYGTRSSRKLKNETLNQKLKLLEDLIPVLEKQISEIKNNYDYVNLTETKSLSSPQIISYRNQFENIITNEEKPKILSIGQKKNEK